MQFLTLFYKCCLKPAIAFWKLAGDVAGFAENVCEQLATRQALWLKCGELLCVCSLARYLCCIMNSHVKLICSFLNQNGKEGIRHHDWLTANIFALSKMLVSGLSAKCNGKIVAGYWCPHETVSLSSCFSFLPVLRLGKSKSHFAGDSLITVSHVWRLGLLGKMRSSDQDRML